jgi:poly(3-hydroxybutyrate) depolymerase
MSASMTRPTISLLVAASLLAACGSDAHPASVACESEAGCAGGSSPGGDTAIDSGIAAQDDAAGLTGSDAAAGGNSTDGSLAQDSGAMSTNGDGGPSGDVKPSAGCGMPAPTAGDTTIDVSGTSREYILTLPANYDPTRRYKLIFAWHGQGGTAAQIAAGYYGLQTQAANGTIFVAGQGLVTTNSVGTGAGWANTNGEDVAFVKAMYARFQSTICFDESRVFSVGMSYGGIMSDTLGCAMGDVFRAIAPMSGEGPGYGSFSPACVGEVAVWMSNGNNDTVVPTAQEEASRDFWVKKNHCEMTSKAVTPSPCLAYDGCDTGYPVTWCEFAGGHTIPSFAPTAIWAFFSQF